MNSPVRQRINIRGVRERYPASDVTIWRKTKAGQFPAPHYIGRNRYWYADEVDAWIEAQIARTPTERAAEAVRQQQPEI